MQRFEKKKRKKGKSMVNIIQQKKMLTNINRASDKDLCLDTFQNRVYSDENKIKRNLKDATKETIITFCYTFQFVLEFPQ